MTGNSRACGSSRAYSAAPASRSPTRTAASARTQARVPVGVHRQGAAPVSGELGDQPARVLRRPGLGVDQRQVQRATRRRRARPRRPRRAARGPSRRSAAGRRGCARAGSRRRGGVRVVGLAPSASARSASSRRLGPAAGQQRERAAPQRHVPAEVRQGDGVGERLVGVDLRSRLPDAAELEQVDHAPVAPLQHRLAIAGRLGGGDHVAGDGQPLVGVVRGPQRDAVGVQRGRERGGIVGAPRPLHGEGAELAGTSGVRVVQLDREPCEQPRGRRRDHRPARPRAPPRAGARPRGRRRR